MSSEKLCFRCEKKKPLPQFYKHPQMADGYFGKCIECTKKDNRENRQHRKEYYQQYDRDRHQRPERREQWAESGRRYKERYPERVKARRAVSNAIRDGRLTKQPCSLCSSVKAEAHHPDYSKPLDVVWVCKDCHEANF